MTTQNALVYAVNPSEPIDYGLATGYSELALDPGTWDVAVPLRLLRGGEAILQRVKVRFRFFLGEWFLDQRLGIPYYRDILVKRPNLPLIGGIFRQALATTPGIKAVRELTTTLDNSRRRLLVDFDAVLDTSNAALRVTNEPFIIG